jgi:hypothetical protein
MRAALAGQVLGVGALGVQGGSGLPLALLLA